MDHGSLTDHNGKKIDFRNVILIMTTNAGAAEMAKAAIGFGSSKRTGEDEEAINRLFTPEFRNRLDAIIPFAPLPTEVIHQVVQKFVMQLETQLSERNVTFDLHQDAVAWLAEKGYDERMGARPLSRVIQEHIKKPLANEILFGALRKGGVVKVTVGKKDDGKDGLVLESIPEAVPVKPKPEVEPEVEETTVKAKAGKAKTDAPSAKSPARDKPAPKAKLETDSDVLTEEPDERKPRKGSTVPRVPKKK
jgi:ATP-dependent Clp protease ATP-binding subunit ClpA